MTSNKERVFVIGATGAIGSGIVRGLVKKQVSTTGYVRDEQKAKDLFKDELKTGYLKLVVGDYSSTETYAKAIEGHTRLFLLIVAFSKPDSKGQIKETLAKIAFERGVRQIVDLSSAFVGTSGKDGFISYMNTTAEEKLWTLANENSEQRSLVVLRPAGFMSNQLRADVREVKQSNKLVSCGPPSGAMTWIDTKDISDCAVVILTESVEKHDRMVYEMGAEVITNQERAAIFSKVLGKSIKYEQQTIDEFYKSRTKFGMSHGIVYHYVSCNLKNTSGNATPQLAIVLGRPLCTLEEWLRENAAAFQ